MIIVNMVKDGDCHIFNMKGHAKSKTEGSPEVCAACSALAYTLLGWVLNNGFADAYHKEAYGNVRIYVDASDKSCATQCATSAVWQAVEIGLRQIAQAYPQFVTVK